MRHVPLHDEIRRASAGDYYSLEGVVRRLADIEMVAIKDYLLGRIPILDSMDIFYDVVRGAPMSPPTLRVYAQIWRCGVSTLEAEIATFDYGGINWTWDETLPKTVDAFLEQIKRYDENRTNQ
jgi:hypothetical protein